MKTRRSILVAALGVFPAALALQAAKEKEEPTRTVKGLVTDEAEKPIQQAVVQLKNTRTMDVKSYYTDAQGRFYFAGLDPNIDYEIKAMAKGLREKTRRVSSFDDRMELFYEFNLKAE
ncbi:MAG: carboxypeptidase regulatory-like domain-containing protein [Bryobacterales bacterium]|nr:carboxypeptidase regulatory-like domain-containing protein [Acidobacteriota bacterium]MCB9385281.1 carboxypeptidase regulatory-like domain-containing protein [Bryobacterales bacterium]